MYSPYSTREIEGFWPVPENSDPFRATIVTSLTFAEIEAISIDADTKYEDLWKAIAPYVVEWNVSALNRETGERELLPPPSKEGWEIFRKTEGIVSVWLAKCLRNAHLGNREEREEKKAPTEPTLGGKPDSDSDSIPPEPSPSNPTGTT